MLQYTLQLPVVTCLLFQSQDLQLNESFASSGGDLYNPEEPLSDDDENLVIDDEKENTPDASPVPPETKDTETVSEGDISDCKESEQSSSSNKIIFKMSSDRSLSSKGNSSTSTKSPENKSGRTKKIISDIFGSDEEEETIHLSKLTPPRDGDNLNETKDTEMTGDPSIDTDDESQVNISNLDPALISCIENTIAEEREKVDAQKKLARARELQEE